MQNLQAALSMLQRLPDAKLFPAHWNGKGHSGYIKWGEHSSADPAQITAWAKQWPTCYFCVAAQASNVTPLDIDNKKGKNGSATLLDLVLDNGQLPDTLIAQTPSGGLHYLFVGKSAVTVGKLGTGIDTPVMVPVPGSTVPGKGEYHIVKEAPLARTPEWISRLAGEAKERDPDCQTPACELDLEHNIDRATRYAMEAEPSLQGSGGDQHAYSVACRLRDLGVSENTCAQLMLEHWYPRCEPNNKPEFISRKVRNAYRYAQDKAGHEAPDALFPLHMPNGKLFTSFNDLCTNLQPPRYIVKKYIEEETTALWFGDPGNLKSFMAVDMGVAIATGQEWAGRGTTQGTVFYICGEGHGGIARRLVACKQQRGISNDMQVPFYVSNSSIAMTNDTHVIAVRDDILRLSQEFGTPKLVIVDTLAANFGAGDENSTKDMGLFINLLTRLRKDLKCSVLVVHHSGHGDKNRGRGASALDAGIDAVYKVHRDDMMVCLRMPTKMKDGEPQPDTWFDVQVKNVGIDEDLSPVTSLSLAHLPGFVETAKVKVIKLDKWKGLIRDMVIEEERVPIENVQAEYKARREEDGMSYDRANFGRAVKTLIAANIILREGDLLVDPSRAEILPES